MLGSPRAWLVESCKLLKQKDTVGNSGPLAGVKVIDFGQYIAGPAVAMMLADLGAEVIRIDPPGGPRWISPANAVLNRNKKSIVLDLKSDEGKEIAKALVASADVVIENFRPGVMKRLGLDANQLLVETPKLVYLSMPGFSSVDPHRASIQAWEGIVAAATGIYTDMGISRVLMKETPYYTPIPLASAYATAMGALSVMTALVRSEKDGVGDIIEVPLASAVMEGLVYNSMVVEDEPERYKTLRGKAVEARIASGDSTPLSYDEVQELIDPMYRNYMCADGRPFYNEAVGNVSHPVKALKALGVWDDLVAQGLPLGNPYQRSAMWPDNQDCTLTGYPLSKKWADKVAARLKEVFLTKTSGEWEQLYRDLDLPGAAQQTLKEWLSDEHAWASGLLVSVNDPVWGKMTQPGSMVWLKNSAEVASIKRPAPQPDADREEILKSLNRLPNDDEANPPTLDNKRQPLAGVRILDLSNIIAGPTIATTLARFGADVISIDPVEAYQDPSITILLGMQANRGKRSLLLDLKTADGQKILERLVKTVDMVVCNRTDSQLEKLGLDYKSLSDINPDVVLCQVTAFDGPRKGSRSEQRGYDDLVQAITGVMTRFGGDLKTPEEHAHVGTIDALSGYMAAFSGLVALFNRERGHGADVAKTALVTAGELIQIPFMYDFEGRPAFDEPSGPDAKGEHALYRLYPVSDGWVFLATDRNNVDAIGRLKEFPDIAEQDEQSLAAYLEAGFVTKSKAYWLGRFNELNIAAHSVDTMAKLRAENTVHESTVGDMTGDSTFLFLREENHPSGYNVVLNAPNAIRFKQSSVVVPYHAPKCGAHTREILKEIGFEDEQINQLESHRIVSSSWSEQYLPD